MAISLSNFNRLCTKKFLLKDSLVNWQLTGAGY